MIKLSVTGSTGFVGENLVKFLKKRHFDLNCLSRKQIKSDEVFNDEFAFIHLAGKAHDLKKTSNPEEYYKVNFEITKKLYDEFLKSDVKKFVFISSVKAAADVVGGVLTEDVIPKPQTHYGKSKLMAEEYIQSQPLPHGKFYYILRPCMIHGPGNKGNLNLLYKIVQKGIPYPLAAFENERSFLSVDNLCFVIDNLIQKDIASGIYNVADDKTISTNQLVSILAHAAGKKAKLWHISKPFIRLAAKLGDILHLPLNTEKLNKLTENYIVSNQKLKSAIRVELPLQAKEGIILTVKSFLT